MKSWLPRLVAAAMIAASTAFFASGARADCAGPQQHEPALYKAAEVDQPLVASIDLSDQIMSVYVEGDLLYAWPVSTGMAGFATPTGEWHPLWLSPDHHSSKYGWAPMPWSVFFYGGYAIHGTTEIENLGQPASHGCIRLHPDNAKTFYDLVVEYGFEQSLIRIVE